MKRFILFSIFLLIFHLGYSQFYLGKTREELALNLSKTKGHSVPIYDDSKGLIKWKEYSVNTNCVAYYDGKHVIYKLYMIPDDKQTFNSLIEQFNKDYVKIDVDVWHAFVKNEVIKIQTGWYPNTNQNVIIYTKL